MNGLEDFIGGYIDQKIKESKEDLEALKPYKDDFLTLGEIGYYFFSHREDFSNITSDQVKENPKAVTEKFKEANAQLARGWAAIKNIRQSKLRFSEKVLGPAVEKFEQVLTEFEGGAIRKLNFLISQTKYGKSKWIVAPALKLKYGEDKLEDFHDLAVEIKQTQFTIKKIKSNVEGIIDHRLTGYCNITAIDLALRTAAGGKDIYEKGKEYYEIWKKVAWAIEKSEQFGL